MKWWIRSLRPAWALGSSIAGTLVVVLAPDLFALPVPSLSGPSAFGSVRLHALVALLIVICAWASVSTGHKSAVLAATRSMRMHTVAFVLVLILVCGAIIGTCNLFDHTMPAAALVLLRDVAGLLGFGLVCVPLVGYRFAGVLVTAYVFASAIFGRTGDGGSALWAWPISDSTDLCYWAPAIALFVVGCLVCAFSTRYSRVMITQAMS